MKLTNQTKEMIHDRIQREVKKKFNFETLKQEIEKEDAFKNELTSDFLNKIRKEFNELLEANGYANSGCYGEVIEMYPYKVKKKNSASERLNELESKMRQEVKLKYENVILALEFGAAKKDFELIISEELAK